MGIIKKMKDLFSKGDDPIEQYEMEEDERSKIASRNLAGGTELGMGTGLETDSHRNEAEKKNDKEEIKEHIRRTGTRLSR